MYYPLTQITTNLYTNGEEFMYKNNLAPYSGYYWKTSKNEYFTGKTPQDTWVSNYWQLNHNWHITYRDSNHGLEQYGIIVKYYANYKNHDLCDGKDNLKFYIAWMPANHAVVPAVEDKTHFYTFVCNLACAAMGKSDAEIKALWDAEPTSVKLTSLTVCDTKFLGYLHDRLTGCVKCCCLLCCYCCCH